MSHLLDEVFTLKVILEVRKLLIVSLFLLPISELELILFFMTFSFTKI